MEYVFDSVSFSWENGAHVVGKLILTTRATDLRIHHQVSTGCKWRIRIGAVNTFIRRSKLSWALLGQRCCTREGTHYLYVKYGDSKTCHLTTPVRPSRHLRTTLKSLAGGWKTLSSLFNTFWPNVHQVWVKTWQEINASSWCGVRNPHYHVGGSWTGLTASYHCHFHPGPPSCPPAFLFLFAVLGNLILQP